MSPLLALAHALRPLARAPGVVEAVLYGSLVRGDYIPGCSDIDIFLVVAGPTAPVRLARSLAMTGAVAGELRPRGIDVAWCTVDEVLRHECTYKFLTMYRDDFERNSMIVAGKPVHMLQPARWSPGERCRRLLLLLNRPGMRGIVAGEAVKLWLWLRGYRGPWDKWSVGRAVESLDRSGCASGIWRSYLSCGRPPGWCDEWVRVFLVECAGSDASQTDI